jgi:hypothetical protein
MKEFIYSAITDMSFIEEEEITVESETRNEEII